MLRRYDVPVEDLPILVQALEECMDTGDLSDDTAESLSSIGINPDDFKEQILNGQ